MLPIFLGGILLLIQPGILLYDRIVMQEAAAEGCRLLATSADASPGGTCEQYIRRRLGAVPQQDNFHVHSGGCSWEIEFSGSEASSEVGVAISTAVKPLPLIDFAAHVAGLTSGDGYFHVEVSATAPTQPSWVSSAGGGDPSTWIGAWMDE